MTVKIKNVLFVLFLVSGLLISNIARAEETNPQNQPVLKQEPQAANPQGAAQAPEQTVPQAAGQGAPQAGGPPIANLPPPQFRLPPAIIVKGKERELNKVFVEDASVNKPVKAEFIAFDIDPSGILNPLKSIGTPPGSSFEAIAGGPEKNKAQAVFSWTPREKDKGLHGFAFEVSNAKGDINRVALFYDVK